MSMRPSAAPGISSVNISDVPGVRNDRYAHDSLDQLLLQDLAEIRNGPPINGRSANADPNILIADSSERVTVGDVHSRGGQTWQ